MATTVERQMSTFSDTSTLQQSRRHSIEVIDVDLLDDSSPVDSGTQQPPPHPVARQMPESILVIDSSDDEDNELSQGQPFGPECTHKSADVLQEPDDSV